MDSHWAQLSANECEDVYRHILEIIQDNDAEPEFLTAVKATKANMDAVRNEDSTDTTTTTTDTSTTIDSTIRGTSIRPGQLLVLETPTKNEGSSVALFILEESRSIRRIDAWQDDVEAGRAPPSYASSPSRVESFQTAEDGRTPSPNPPPRLRRTATATGPPVHILVNPPPIARAAALMQLDQRLDDLSDAIDDFEHSEVFRNARQAVCLARQALLRARSSSGSTHIGLFEVKMMIAEAERVFQEATAAVDTRASTSMQTPSRSRQPTKDHQLGQLSALTRNLQIGQAEPRPQENIQAHLQHASTRSDSRSAATPDVEEIRSQGAAEEARSRHRRPSIATPSYPSFDDPVTARVPSGNPPSRRRPAGSQYMPYQVGVHINALQAQNSSLQRNLTECMNLHWIGDIGDTACRCADPVSVHGFAYKPYSKC